MTEVYAARDGRQPACHALSRNPSIRAERICYFQRDKPPEILIGGEDLLDSVLNQQRRDVSVVQRIAGDGCCAKQLSNDLAVAVAFGNRND